MAYYKLCDCGMKNTFERRNLAPRTCKNCGRNLVDVSTRGELCIDKQEELMEKETLEDEEVEERFYYSLNTIDGINQIIIPSSGAIVGRNALGADILANHTSVSREHIKIFYHGEMCLVVEDISKFGTYVNDKKLVKGIKEFVYHGSVIKLYDFELIVQRHEEE